MPDQSTDQERADQDDAVPPMAQAERESLILRHLGLVGRLARRFSSRGAEVDDLVQVGSEGLIKALDRFDPRMGVPFAAFAFPTVVGEIQRYYRDRADLVRYPRRLQELRVRRARVAERLAQELGRMPAATEIQEAMPGVDARTLDDAAAQRRPISLTWAGAAAGGEALGEELAGAREDEELARVEDRATVRQMLGRLSPRERILLHQRFYEGLSQAQTARRLGVSQMHVSRWERRAIEKLRRLIDY